MNKFLRIKLLSSILVLSFVTVQTCPCAYAFSLPFKKKKTEKIEQTKETSALQIKAEKNEIVEYSLEDCIDIALKNDPNIKIYTTQKGIAHSQLVLQNQDIFQTLQQAQVLHLNRTETRALAEASTIKAEVLPAATTTTN